jgi:NAD(P)-dependent dehydrogenase (short-subunit alcohol dehydrogenase family)
MLNNTAPAPRPLISELSALVVGATGGIGLAVARALAGSVARLSIHGRDPAKLASRAAELGALGASISTVRADLSDGEPTAGLLAAAGAADLVVVAYGPFVYKPLAGTSPADWRRMALSCLALPGAIATEAAINMAARGFGRILLFGGTRTDAIRGYKSNAAYASAKTGLGVLAKSIAAEFAGRGVSCSVVCPGFVDTEYLDQETRERLAAASPRGRLIPSEDIAGLAMRLLGGDMDLTNGSITVADEGLYSL